MGGVINRDLTGMVFNDLHVDSLADPIIRSSGQIKRAWNCTCICGKKVVVTQNALVSGTTKSCGCLSKRLSASRRTDLTGQRFTRLLVEKLDHVHETPSGQKKPFWRCICDCGNRVVVSSGSLKNGYTKSCGCLRSESISKRLRQNLTGMRFGLLTAERDTGKSKKRHAVWQCKCVCGNYKEVPSDLLLSGKTTSCGCIGSSKGEHSIEQVLRAVHFQYEREYEFDDLRGPGGGKLRFDFAVFQDKKIWCLIEYHGEQHYMKKAGDFGALQREITDPMKQEYCKQHNIPLIIVAYTDDIVNKLGENFRSLTRHANSVPSSKEKV